VKRFLLVRLGSLGDVIHAIPAVAALRTRYPYARIDWMIDPAYVDLLGIVSGVDRAVPMDPRASKGQLLATLRELRATGYDAVIDLQGLLKSAVLARMAGGRETIGFPRGDLREPAASLFYSRTTDPGPSRHVVHKNLALLSTVDVFSPEIAFPLRVPTDRAGVPAKPYILINPGAAWPNKRWPPDRFGALAARVWKRYGIRTVVAWGPGEEAMARAVVDAAEGSAELSPPTSIVDLFAVCRGARLMVSGDTGPLHIAAAVGTPIVALFGPTDPERNGPWRSEDVTVSRCEQCACHYQRACRRAVPCITTIELEEVVGAVARRLKD
jgi:lipopolysaccharide heptosyltransferase I